MTQWKILVPGSLLTELQAFQKQPFTCFPCKSYSKNCNFHRKIPTAAFS